LGYIRFQSGWERLAFSDEVSWIPKQIGENMQNPSPLPAWSGGILLPLIIGSTQSLGLGRIASV
jgi:hypothetical protein